MPFSPDFDEDFVQMPLPLRASPHRFGPTFPDLVREVRSEPVDPKADTLVADIDAALMQQVFDVSKRVRKSDVHHHTELDDLGRGFEVPERVFAHFPRLNALPGRLKAGSADNASSSIDFMFDPSSSA